MRTIVTLLALAMSLPALAGEPGRELVSGEPYGGKWVGAQPKVEAYCARKARGQAVGGCGALRWVERWGKDAKRRFLMVPVDEVVLERLTDKAAAARMLDGDVTVWRSGLANEVAGGVRKGDAFDLYAVDKAAKVTTCKVTGFSLLTRGQPHFGWIQMAERKKPKRPGCGSPVLFAELRCDEDPGFVELAVAADTPGPTVFEQFTLTDAKKTALIAALKRGPVFAQEREKAEAEAAKKGQPLVEQISLDGFKSGDKSLVVVSLVWMTGEGMIECGGDDLRLDYKGIGGWKPGGQASVVVPFEQRDQTTVRGLMSKPGEDTFLLIEQVFPSTTRIEPLGRDGNTCEIGIDFCDCPC